MKIRELHRETLVAAPLEETFTFFTNPDNLLKVTPDTFPTTILNKEPITMEKGTLIRLKMRLFKLFPVKWETKIEEWDPPHKFVDTQPSGPYRYWRHIHRFEAVGDNTRIIDSVQYAVPGWIIEPIVHSLIVRKSLINLFDYRQKKYKELLGTP
jgi:ligand-binding SRPBCC domain-containing protein